MSYNYEKSLKLYDNKIKNVSVFFQKSYKSSENAKLYDISDKKQLLFCNQKRKNGVNVI